MAHSGLAAADRWGTTYTAAGRGQRCRTIEQSKRAAYLSRDGAGRRWDAARRRGAVKPTKDRQTGSSSARRRSTCGSSSTAAVPRDAQGRQNLHAADLDRPQPGTCAAWRDRQPEPREARVPRASARSVVVKRAIGGGRRRRSEREERGPGRQRDLSGAGLPRGTAAAPGRPGIVRRLVRRPTRLLRLAAGQRIDERAGERRATKHRTRSASAPQAATPLAQSLWRASNRDGGRFVEDDFKLSSSSRWNRWIICRRAAPPRRLFTRRGRGEDLAARGA